MKRKRVHIFILLILIVLGIVVYAIGSYFQSFKPTEPLPEDIMRKCYQYKEIGVKLNEFVSVIIYFIIVYVLALSVYILIKHKDRLLSLK